MNKLGTKLAVLAVGGALLTGVAITSGAAQTGEKGASDPAQPVLVGDFTDTTSTTAAAQAAPTAVPTAAPTAPNTFRPEPESDAARAALLQTLPTIRTGSTGGSVLALQIGLRAQGATYLQGTGTYGALTVRAVKEFQHGHGLTADGIVGGSTWEALIPRGTGAPYWLANPQLRPGQAWSQASSHELNQPSEDYLRYGLSRLCDLTPWAPTTDDGSTRYAEGEVAVVRELQRRAGLTPSGILGERTVRVIVLISAVNGGFGN